MPLLTIITITFNAEEFIERTLKSIHEQVFKNFEYLLIDGNSTDRTMQIVEAHPLLFDRVISEPDNGLYDAMNKGLRLATGDYLWFINAGDEIASPEVCKKLSELISEQNPDVIYGETTFTDRSGSELGTRSMLTPHKLPATLNWEKMKYGMLVCHQSFIAKRDIAPEFIANNLSADVDWEISILKSARKIIKYEGILSKYLIGGISNQRLGKSLRDRFFVLKTHFGLFQTLVAHVKIFGRGVLKILNDKGKYW